MNFIVQQNDSLIKTVIVLNLHEVAQREPGAYAGKKKSALTCIFLNFPPNFFLPPGKLGV